LLAASEDVPPEEWLRKRGAGWALDSGVFLGRVDWKEVLMPPTRLEFEMAMEVLRRSVIGANVKNAALVLEDLAEMMAWTTSWTDVSMKARHKRRTARTNAKEVPKSVRALLPDLVAAAVKASYEKAKDGQLEDKRAHMVALLGLVGLWRMGEVSGLFVTVECLRKWDDGKVVRVLPLWSTHSKTRNGVFRLARIERIKDAHWCPVRAIRAWYRAVGEKVGAKALTFETMVVGRGGRGRGPAAWAVFRALEGRSVEKGTGAASVVAKAWLKKHYEPRKDPMEEDRTPDARKESGHSFRSTGALMCLAAGMPADQVKRGARWSSDAMLRLYTRAEVLLLGKTLAEAGQTELGVQKEAAMETELVAEDQLRVDEAVGGAVSKPIVRTQNTKAAVGKRGAQAAETRRTWEEEYTYEYEYSYEYYPESEWSSTGSGHEGRQQGGGESRMTRRELDGSTSSGSCSESEWLP